MSRSVPWRRACSDVVHWRQLQAIQARIYVLQESGPTAFIVKEHDSAKKLRVTLGDPSACTCTTFLKEHELCIHILWVILKLFRIPPENPISWQGSLVEREIHQIVKSRESTRAARAAPPAPAAAGKTEEQGSVEPRPVEEGDCCPICQDEMSAGQALTYCRYSCGHSIHSRCMKIWADHQLSQGAKILCPMCRAEFGTLKMIMTDHLKKNAFRRDVHPGTTCHNCNTTPISGKIYACTICDLYNLCMQCFAAPNHTHHPFQYKEKPAHRWRAAVRDLTTIPPQLAAELENRDITENDYETLLTLDNGGGTATGGLTSKEIASLKCVMLTKKSSLLNRADLHCDVCLAGFSLSQHVVELPCSHKFHKVCADNWLSHTHDYCPTCTEPVVVALPTRRPTTLKRYNVKEVEPEDPGIVFSLSGSAVTSRPRDVTPQEKSHDVTDNNSNGALRKGPALRSRRASRPRNILPSFVEPSSLSIGAPSSSSSSSSVLKQLARPAKHKPPRPPKNTEETSGIDLMIGSGGSDSPINIIRRISSVHDRPSSRSASPKRRGKERRFLRDPSPEREIKPELVLVNGVGIS